MRRLVFVRHGRPVVRADEAPSAWSLDRRAGNDVAELARRLALPVTAVIVSSPERKATATAAALFPAAVFIESPDLREVIRPWYDVDEVHQAATRSYLTRQPLHGWEPLAQATERFQHAVDALPQDRDVVVVTHGTVFAAWLQQSELVADAFHFWSDLGQPDAWELDAGRGRITRLS